MAIKEFEVGDVVQLHPQVPTFGGCFMVVEEVAVWGVMGYVMTPMKGGAAPAYYRAEQGYYKRIGKVEWKIGARP